MIRIISVLVLSFMLWSCHAGKVNVLQDSYPEKSQRIFYGKLYVRGEFDDDMTQQCHLEGIGHPDANGLIVVRTAFDDVTFPRMYCRKGVMMYFLNTRDLTFPTVKPVRAHYFGDITMRLQRDGGLDISVKDEHEMTSMLYRQAGGNAPLAAGIFKLSPAHPVKWFRERNKYKTGYRKILH